MSSFSPFPHFVSFCILFSSCFSFPLLSSPRGCWWKSAVFFKAWAESSRSQTGLCEWKVNGWPLNIYWECGRREASESGGGVFFQMGLWRCFSLLSLCVCLHWWETEAASEALHYLLSGLVCTFSFIRFMYVCVLWDRHYGDVCFSHQCECHHFVLVCTDVAFTRMLVSWSVWVYVLSHNLIIISCSQWQTDRETDVGVAYKKAKI